MSARKTIVRVYPSASARDEALWNDTAAAPEGLYLPSPLWTIEELLTRVVDDMELPPGKAVLSPLAGAMLVQEIIRDSPEIFNNYAGLHAVWRLPRGLWRLIIEVKAAGLNAEMVKQEKGSGIEALSRLMFRYQKALDQRGLMDQADRLAYLEKMLTRGQRPEVIAEWAEVRMGRVLWLRALDLRLLRALGQVMKVSVNLFLIPPAAASLNQLTRLLEKTYNALERDRKERIAIKWLDMDEDGGPLAALANDYMDPAAVLADPHDHLSLTRSAGRYSEVQHLLEHALSLVESGMAPHDIVLVFPSFDLYGPMAQDIAARIGIPLAYRPVQALSNTPLARDLLALLRLGLGGFAANDLAGVMDSPYVGGSLARSSNAAPPVGAGRLLATAGYVERRVGPADACLEQAAKRMRRDKAKFAALANLYRAVEHLLVDLKLDGPPRTPAGWVQSIKDMLARLDLKNQILSMPTDPNLGPTTASDLLCLEQLQSQIEQFAQATKQVSESSKIACGRLVTMLEAYWAESNLKLPTSQAYGVRLLRLDQAVGLHPHTLLAGGLNQGEFPKRPAGQNLLSKDERLSLGKASPLKMPVWRLEIEEYAGQVLQLLWLIGSAKQAVVLSSCAADSTGREIYPASAWTSLRYRLDKEVDNQGGAIYGEVPPLEECRDFSSLQTRLSSTLLRPQSKETSLAQATLFALGQDAAFSHNWQAMAKRAIIEHDREQINLLDSSQRFATANGHWGRIGSDGGADLLSQVLDAKFRKWSPTSLEDYAQCPMKWFFKYLMGVWPIDSPGWGLSKPSEGRWVHEALRIFFEPGEYDPNWSDEERNERLSSCIDQAQADLQQTGEPGHPSVWRARKEALLPSLRQIVQREATHMEDSKPVAVEHSLDPGVEVKVHDESSLWLSGRLDRLDQGPGLLRVSDYKHTKNMSGLRDAVNEDLVGVASFQAPIYLAGADQLFGQDNSTLVARFLSTLKPKQKVYEMEVKPGNDLLADDPQRRAQISATNGTNLFESISDIWQRLQKGDFVATPSKNACEWCPSSLVCRARVLVMAEEGSP